MKKFLAIILAMFLIALLIFLFLKTTGEEKPVVTQGLKSKAPSPAVESSDFEEDAFEDFKIEAALEEALTATDTDPPAFLETDYEPLAKWLGERFEVDYKAMTPELIFDQVPLNDIFYERSDFPRNPAPFDLETGDISRRELLKKISEFWNLDMSLVLGKDGQPMAVEVRGR